MDALDEKLITLLRHDARRSISDLATDLGVSRATVRARMERLERRGDIRGYTVVLRGDVADLPVRGIAMIEIEGHATDRVVRALSGMVEVSGIHTTNGRWDLMLEIGTTDLIAFDAALRKIRLIPGILRSETNLILSTRRSAKAAL